MNSRTSTLGSGERSSDIGATRTAEILETLRGDIVEARLKPGHRLRFDELRKNYSIGISPLREALMQLASEGLVISEQRRGFRVAPVSRSDLYEIARLRSEIDGIAVRESIKNGDERWEGRILAAFHALQRRKKIGPDGEIDPVWDVCHVEFHNELVAQCRMPKLLALREIFDAQAKRYRRIAVHYLTSPRDDVGEHRAIMDAILERDPAAATKLLADHYMTTVEIILQGSAPSDELTIDGSDL